MLLQLILENNEDYIDDGGIDDPLIMMRNTLQNRRQTIHYKEPKTPKKTLPYTINDHFGTSLSPANFKTRRSRSVDFTEQTDTESERDTQIKKVRFFDESIHNNDMIVRKRKQRSREQTVRNALRGEVCFFIVKQFQK